MPEPPAGEEDLASPGQVHHIPAPIGRAVSVGKSVSPARLAPQELPSRTDCAATVELGRSPIPPIRYQAFIAIDQHIPGLPIRRCELNHPAAVGQPGRVTSQVGYGRVVVCAPFTVRGKAESAAEYRRVCRTPETRADRDCQCAGDGESGCAPVTADLPASQGCSYRAVVPQPEGLVPFTAEGAVDVGRGDEQPGRGPLKEGEVEGGGDRGDLVVAGRRRRNGKLRCCLGCGQKMGKGNGNQSSEKNG